MKKKKKLIGYFRPRNVNPEWYAMWVQMLKNGESYSEVLDVLCENACGISVGSADSCQTYARHIHAHLEAAFQIGKACRD